MSETVPIKLTINGQSVRAAVEPRLTAVDFIRDHLGLTGTHVGCEHGVCGACTILDGDKAVRSCLELACRMDGACVTTVEGLGSPEALTPLQESFRRHHALQCGFCTPGMLVAITALLRENAHPDEEQVRDAISGNLCRCTGYVPIVEAVMHVVRQQSSTSAEGCS
jgi:carbon-monoxide dehydrogenase small subunit